MPGQGGFNRGGGGQRGGQRGGRGIGQRGGRGRGQSGPNQQQQFYNQ